MEGWEIRIWMPFRFPHTYLRRFVMVYLRIGFHKIALHAVTVDEERDSRRESLPTNRLHRIEIEFTQ